MRIRDWSSDVCASELPANHVGAVEPLDASPREGETIFKGAHPLTELSFRGFKAVLHHRDDCVGEFFLGLLFPVLDLLADLPPIGVSRLPRQPLLLDLSFDQLHPLGGPKL